MANVGSSTKFLDMIQELIAAGEKIPANLREEAASKGFKRTVERIDAHNAGEDLAPLVKAERTKAEPATPPTATEIGPDVAEKNVKALEDLRKKGGDKALSEELAKRRQQEGLEPGAVAAPKTPKKIKELAEKGGSPVEPTSAAEAPASPSKPLVIRKKKEATPAIEATPAPTATTESQSLENVKKAVEPEIAPPATAAAKTASSIEQKETSIPIILDTKTNKPVPAEEARSLQQEYTQAVKEGTVEQFKQNKLKPLGYTLLALGGLGTAAKTLQPESSTTNQITPPSPASTPTEPSKPTTPPAAPSVTAPTEPAAPQAPQAAAPAKKGTPFAAGSPEELSNYFKKIQEIASPMSQLDKATQERLTGLEQNLNSKIQDATKLYEETVQNARSDADRREAILTWASIGEQLGQAVTKYFAAREGQRLGARIGSEMKFEKHDWAGDLDRSLKKMESQLSGAKEKYGMVSKEVEAGREALGKERTRIEDRAVKQADTFIKAALDEREQQREEQSRMRLKAQDLALAQVQNAAKLNQAIQIQQMKMDLSKENLKTKLSTKQNTEIDKVGKSRTQSTQLFFALYDAKKDKRGAAAKAFADASADLLLTQEESAQLDNLSKGPNIGRKGLMPTYTSDEENKATAAAILQRAEIRRINQLSGGQFNVVGGTEEGQAPATQTSGQEPTFSVIFEGYENDPRTMTEAQFKAAQAKYGARVKKVGAQ